METLEQYKNRQVVVQLKAALTLLHSAKLEAAAQQLTLTDIEAAEIALDTAIASVVAELEA